MNQTNMMPAPQSGRVKPSVCRTVPLRAIPGAQRHEMATCALPEQDSLQKLTCDFQAAPQFREISLEKLLERGGAGSLRVILLGEQDYYLRQAAAYLTAISRKRRASEPPARADSFWDDLDFDGLDVDDFDLTEKQTPKERMKNSLVVVSPALLDPSIGRSGSGMGKPGAAASGSEEIRQVNLTSVKSGGILIAAQSGAVLSEGVVNRLECFLEQEEHQDIFVALKSGQVELELLEELRFTHGFQTCRVGQADQDYLRRLLLHTAQELLLPLASGVDLDRVIAQLRRYRGRAFAESDLERLLMRVAERSGKKPVDTADLLVRPCRAHGTKGRDALSDMVGLHGVKDAVGRLLAAAALEDRRRMGGVDIPPSCRNLAFSGNPGTGKSVTARLAAQILREEGCGSGRFVEAGREQLIGCYLGQTSPMIAELFRQARGGVLFIDEAGALLDPDGRDTYAAEAVNALVRHMELEPETMVIFATYPEEMKQLLSSNPGLSSRVAQVLEFPDYTGEELFDIFKTFAQQERLNLPENADRLCGGFFQKLRGRKGTDFGNGREARRLFQAAKEEMALRALSDPGVLSDLSEEDLRGAMERLLKQEREKTRTRIGFGA